MSDNSLQSGSDTIRDIDKGGVKTQVFVMDKGGAGPESLVTEANPFPTKDDAAINLLRAVANLLMSPVGYDSVLNRFRETTVLESGTLTTLSTITNAVPVGNVATLDGRNGAMVINAMDHTAWALNVRSRIT